MYVFGWDSQINTVRLDEKMSEWLLTHEQLDTRSA